MSKRVSLILVLILLVMSLSVTALAGAAERSTEPTAMTPVASGLNNPRHLVFGPDGTMYVAEAGIGGDTPLGQVGPNPNAYFGLSGSITRVENGTQARVVTGLPSIAADDGSEAIGPHDIAVRGRGIADVVIGLGDNPGLRDTLPILADNGTIVRAKLEDNVWRVLEDIAAFEAAENPNGDDVDSNPYALIIDRNYRIIADAGANALLAQHPSGDIKAIATFDARLVEFPPGSGNMIPMQAVPTSVLKADDGSYYVGQLTGFPFPFGGANVFHVVPGEAPQVLYDGFTNIIDLAMDDAGNLYVLEITTNGLLSGDPTGALHQIAPDGTRTLIASAGLIGPGGVAVGPDGALYVTTCTFCGPGAGQVVRIEP
jgi:hypothetical protein